MIDQGLNLNSEGSGPVLDADQHGQQQAWEPSAALVVPAPVAGMAQLVEVERRLPGLEGRWHLA